MRRKNGHRRAALVEPVRSEGAGLYCPNCRLVPKIPQGAPAGVCPICSRVSLVERPGPVRKTQTTREKSSSDGVPEPCPTIRLEDPTSLPMFAPMIQRLTEKLGETVVGEMKQKGLFEVAAGLALLYWRPQPDMDWIRSSERESDIEALRRVIDLAHVPVLPVDYATGVHGLVRSRNGGLIRALSSQTVLELEEFKAALQGAVSRAARRRGPPAKEERRDFRSRWSKAAPGEARLGGYAELAIFNLPMRDFVGQTIGEDFRRRLRDDSREPKARKSRKR